MKRGSFYICDFYGFKRDGESKDLFFYKYNVILKNGRILFVG